MTDYEAEVEPNQPWDEDGTANVTPQSLCPINETKNLPLEHRAKGTHTIYRSEFPDGLVILRQDNLPQGELARLPLRVSTDDEIQVILNQDWPNGGVVWFISD